MLSSPIVPQPADLGPTKKARELGRALNVLVPYLLNLHTARSAYIDDPDMLDTLSLVAQSYSDVVKPSIITALKKATTQD